jgi:hypothetical protein
MRSSYVRKRCETAGLYHCLFPDLLEKVMQPGFSIGTIFFIWTSMVFGVTIHSHFLMSLGSQNASALQSSSPSTCQKILLMIWISNLWWMCISINTAA